MHATRTGLHDHPVQQGFAAGTTIAAAALLLIAGIASLVQGISAAAADELFFVGVQYIYSFDMTTWGWIHIVVGALVIAAAIGLFTGATWARVAGICLAGLSIIANFLWLPYYPVWSIVVIALDVVVIWAIATWQTDRV